MEFSHTPVLLDEVINGLNIRADGIYIDCTLGGAGHSFEIAKRLSTGRLIGIDQDPEALAAAEKRLAGLPVTTVRTNFSNLEQIANDLGLTKVDGILMDLGVSSHQLDTAERGFSYHEDAPLDMRMSGEGLSAFDVVNEYPQQALEKILFSYGEEKYAKSIVRGILRSREEKPINTTLELAEIIKTNVPLSVRREKNPCKKTFQAIRIEVNQELKVLESGLEQAFKLLSVGGRLAVISFHSIEDRIVKNKLKEFATGCTCPPGFPICVCGNVKKGEIITRKPVIASEKELSENNRSRSAKLRIIEKISS